MIHIYNGDVIADLGLRSGLGGEHLVFREALATGPATAPLDIEVRAAFLSDASGEPLLRVRNDLLDQQRALDAAMQHDEIVLWFEHDLFCLANLLYLLARLSAHRRLSMIWHPKPLLDVEMLKLFASRAAVTPRMIAAARQAWDAFTSGDPTSLNRFLQRDHPDFPFLREGLTLHASRFPSLRNGLGVVEQRLLDLVAGGPIDFQSLFPRFDPDPPRLGFGDAEVLRTLRAMASRAVPLVTLKEDGATPPKVFVTITPAAENVLSGEVDHLAVNDPDAWLGGVHLTKENVWRWDEERREIVNPSAAS